VPWLCSFEGRALFLDADMVVTGDIRELLDHADGTDVQVMKQQKPFEWASAMLFNCESCKILMPEFVDNKVNALLDLKWARSIGDLPEEWNRCVGYSPETSVAKLYHFTKGIPCWPETQNNREDQVWYEAFEEANATVSWKELMGQSIHARQLN
jgi:hypothetical protein